MTLAGPFTLFPADPKKFELHSKVAGARLKNNKLVNENNFWLLLTKYHWPQKNEKQWVRVKTRVGERVRGTYAVSCTLYNFC
jgi:hypothetical protein